jgi:hypothetical protein
LLAHGRWFSPGTLANSTTKTGRHDIAEILLKVALKHQKSINQSIVMLLSVCPSFCQSFCNIFVNTRGHIFYSVLTKPGPHFVHTSGSLLIPKFKCQRSRSHLNFNHLLVFILVKTLAYIFQWIWPNLVDTYFIQSLEAYFEGHRSKVKVTVGLKS